MNEQDSLPQVYDLQRVRVAVPSVELLAAGFRRASDSPVDRATFPFVSSETVLQNVGINGNVKSETRRDVDLLSSAEIDSYAVIKRREEKQEKPSTVPRERRRAGLTSRGRPPSSHLRRSGPSWSQHLPGVSSLVDDLLSRSVTAATSLSLVNKRLLIRPRKR
jgi:hypothetical protein